VTEDVTIDVDVCKELFNGELFSRSLDLLEVACDQQANASVHKHRLHHVVLVVGQAEEHLRVFLRGEVYFELLYFLVDLLDGFSSGETEAVEDLFNGSRFGVKFHNSCHVSTLQVVVDFAAHFCEVAQKHGLALLLKQESRDDTVEMHFHSILLDFVKFLSEIESHPLEVIVGDTVSLLFSQELLHGERLAEGDECLSECVVRQVLDHSENTVEGNVGNFTARHLRRQVSHLKDSLVVDSNRNDMEVLLTLLEGGEVHLEKPSDGGVGDHWRVVLSTSQALVVLEHHRQLVLLDQLAHDGLVDVVLLERLVTCAVGLNVAAVLEQFVEQSQARGVFKVADTEGKLNFMHLECVEKEEQISVGFVGGHKHDLLALADQRLQVLDSLLVDEEAVHSPTHLPVEESEHGNESFLVDPAVEVVQLEHGVVLVQADVSTGGAAQNLVVTLVLLRQDSVDEIVELLLIENCGEDIGQISFFQSWVCFRRKNKILAVADPVLFNYLLHVSFEVLYIFISVILHDTEGELASLLEPVNSSNIDEPLLLLFGAH